MPDAWRRAVGRWLRINGSARAKVDGEHAPDRNDEYLFYQTLIGTWPAEPLDAPTPRQAPEDYVRRIQAYMRKAIKEAKIHTSWVNEYQPYERALASFVTTTLRGATAAAFLQAFLPFQRRIARLGAINSLAQLVLKMTSPGVVDFYQGTELWDLTLVDPDNRGPVDFAARERVLAELMEWMPERFWSLDERPDAEQRVAELLTHWTNGRIKMYLTAALLRLRRELPDLWLDGEYLPLRGGDPASDRHLVAFARRLGPHTAIVIAPRFVNELLPPPDQSQPGGQSWPPIGFDTWKTMHIELPDGAAAVTFQNVLTGAHVRPVASSRGAALPAANVFKTLPVAVLLARRSLGEGGPGSS
jgi:(1->4)-alpha-D-glucan 1-alpha-D-glucosylmutase